MMFALALASLLTHLGVTAYRNMSEDLHQLTVARALTQALREARNQAVMRHRTVLVQPIDGEWGKGWHTTLEHNGQLLSEHRPARAVRIVASLNRVVRFTARGAPLGGGFGGVTLYICQPGAPQSQHQVVLSPSGRVSLRSDASSGCAGG